MNLDWQTIVALTIVAGAIGYLVRIVCKRMTGDTSGGCGSCAQSGTADSVRQLPLVQIDAGGQTRDTESPVSQLQLAHPSERDKE